MLFLWFYHNIPFLKVNNLNFTNDHNWYYSKYTIVQKFGVGMMF